MNSRITNTYAHLFLKTTHDAHYVRTQPPLTHQPTDRHTHANSHCAGGSGVGPERIQLLVATWQQCLPPNAVRVRPTCANDTPIQETCMHKSNTAANWQEELNQPICIALRTLASGVSLGSTMPSNQFLCATTFRWKRVIFAPTHTCVTRSGTLAHAINHS